MNKLTELVLEKIDADMFTHAGLTTCIQGSPASLFLFLAAQRIYGPSCISLEPALSCHGWIPESVRTVTSVSFGKSKEFSSPAGTCLRIFFYHASNG